MISYAIFSEEGDRTHNEDSLGVKIIDDTHACFVLCDGLGGHGKGEVASRFVVDSALSIYEQNFSEETVLARMFQESQDSLMLEQKKAPELYDMKTTAVVLQIHEDQLCWGHVGDSRLYYFQNGKIKSRTLDHSVPQMLVGIGELKEKDIRHHPDRSRLLKVMGMPWDAPKYALSENISKDRKQAFLLCSDGFWELIEDRKMERCLRGAKTPQDWLDSMVSIVRKNGKKEDMDNFSAITVFAD